MTKVRACLETRRTRERSQARCILRPLTDLCFYTESAYGTARAKRTPPRYVWKFAPGTISGRSKLGQGGFWDKPCEESPQTVLPLSVVSHLCNGSFARWAQKKKNIAWVRYIRWTCG